jgi:hypothetical protein
MHGFFRDAGRVLEINFVEGVIGHVPKMISLVTNRLPFSTANVPRNR